MFLISFCKFRRSLTIQISLRSKKESRSKDRPGRLLNPALRVLVSGRAGRRALLVGGLLTNTPLTHSRGRSAK